MRKAFFKQAAVLTLAVIMYDYYGRNATISYEMQWQLLMLDGVIALISVAVFCWKRRIAVLIVPPLICLTLFEGVANAYSSELIEPAEYAKVTDSRIGDTVNDILQHDSSFYRIEQMGKDTENAADLNRVWSSGQWVSSLYSSAYNTDYQDFRKELTKSPYRFEVTLFDAFMQGEAAEESIIEALCNVAARPEKFDAVVLIRGGGSRSDLNCFNAYRLCAHVAQFPLPVVTGIGHDKDTSVADMVAHTALKTPTAVAGWLVERMAETDGWLDCAALQLNDMTKAAMHASEVRLERLSGEVRRLSGELLTRQTLRLEHFTELLPDAARDFLARQGVRLGNAAELIAGRSPERILRLGFAVLRAGGRAVTSAGSVAEGEQVEIEVSDGKINATVNSGKIWQKKK